MYHIIILNILVLFANFTSVKMKFLKNIAKNILKTKFLKSETVSKVMFVLNNGSSGLGHM